MCVMQTLIYAGQVMKDEDSLKDYGVPPVSFLHVAETILALDSSSLNYVSRSTPADHLQGCKAMIAIETAKMYAEPDPDSAFWN